MVAANVRPQSTGVVVPLITDPGTARAMDLLNVTNEVLLQLLSRYFAHTDETPEQLAVLADVAVGLMYTAIKPLGTVVTTLPVGPDMPGVTAGPGFELFYSVDYLLPHREAAWVLMEERLRDAAAFAVRCGEQCTPRPDGAAGQGGAGAHEVRGPARWRASVRSAAAHRRGAAPDEMTRRGAGWWMIGTWTCRRPERSPSCSRTWRAARSSGSASPMR